MKIIVEGEEEIGSDHLGEFLQQHKEKLRADVIVLTDTANLDAGIPSLHLPPARHRRRRASRCPALDHPLHSGMWGGPVPDPVQAMAKILASLTDDRGTHRRSPASTTRCARPTAAERARWPRLPFDEEKFSRRRRDGREASSLGGEPGFSVYEQLWLRPTITVIALEASPLKGSSNQIVPAARARISLRVVPEHGSRSAPRTSWWRT